MIETIANEIESLSKDSLISMIHYLYGRATGFDEQVQKKVLESIKTQFLADIESKEEAEE